MRDYATACSSFSIENLEQEVLHGSLSDGLNACIECCDRWAADDRLALDWLGQDGNRQQVTFAEFQARAARFANVLAARGIGRGDVVAGMLPRVPDLITVMLGTWRIGAVYQSLFTAFGPAAIQSRTVGPGSSGAKLVVVDTANRAKLDEVDGCPPVLVLTKGQPIRAGDGDLAVEMAAQPAEFAPVMVRGDDPFALIFTSGTTGRAKGVVYPLRAMLQFAVFVRDGLDLRAEDAYWCFADPGWALGMIGTIITPLLLGHATVLYEGPFSVASTIDVVNSLGVTNLIAAPTVFRMMRAAGEEAVAPIRGRLRVVSSGGEPLNPELNRWAATALGCPIYEFYGQSEMGVNVMNHVGISHEARVGSVGLPSPGMALTVLDDDLNEVPPGTTGVLAVDRSCSPLFFFTGYWEAETPSFRGRWYLSGDTMHRDTDGYLHFVARNDDIITSAGYRIGPSDVESVIIEHPFVAEVAVVGKPDPERTEIVKAFVVLRDGRNGSPELAEELRLLVRHRLSAHAYPRELEFLDALPKTLSGKVQRFVLRQRE